MGDSEQIDIEVPAAAESIVKQRPLGASIIREEFFMGFAISGLLFLVIMLVGGFCSLIVLAATSTFLGGAAFVVTFFLAWFVSAAVRIALQWERAIVLRLGKLKGLRGPGMFFIIPIIEAAAVIDTRVQTLDIPKQQVITKDNVPVAIDAVLYFKVVDPIAAIVNVQSYTYAVSNFAQATLRDVIGGMTLDELLAERQKIGEEIEKFVEAESKNWGLEITNIKIQDINMPEDLKRMMSRQASAEREKRANITKAEGDMLAAVNLAAAAKTMAASNGAMQLRTLQTIDGLGPTASNTVVLAVPIEIMEAIMAFKKNQEAK
ncbi:MAG: SPFH domain-containing protein [Candidatus Margulisiibacteriota bacterium]